VDLDGYVYVGFWGSMIGLAAKVKSVIIGDDGGVVVVPRKIASEVLERAERQLDADRSAHKPYLDKTGIAL